MPTITHAEMPAGSTEWEDPHMYDINAVRRPYQKALLVRGARQFKSAENGNDAISSFDIFTMNIVLLWSSSRPSRNASFPKDLAAAGILRTVCGFLRVSDGAFFPMKDLEYSDLEQEEEIIAVYKRVDKVEMAWYDSLPAAYRSPPNPDAYLRRLTSSISALGPRPLYRDELIPTKESTSDGSEGRRAEVAGGKCDASVQLQGIGRNRFEVPPRPVFSEQGPILNPQIMYVFVGWFLLLWIYVVVIGF